MLLLMNESVPLAFMLAALTVAAPATLSTRAVSVPGPPRS